MKVVWNMQDHNYWGDNIQWFNFEKRELNGWTPRTPRIGDEIVSKMKSGKTARFEFTKVEPQSDPRDMWFGNVKDLGYVE